MMENNLNLIIRNYLKKVEENLPNWLRKNKRELKDIMDELEEHIWDKAEELSEFNHPTIESIKLAILHMGKPNNIAREYKKRGTPHVYITKELWPLYKKVLFSSIIIIAIFNVISLFLNFSVGNIHSIFDIFGYFIGIFVAFTIITIIFFTLSKEGYVIGEYIPKSSSEKEDYLIEQSQKIGYLNDVLPKKRYLNPSQKFIEGIIIFVIGLGLWTLLDLHFDGIYHYVFVSNSIFLMILGFLLTIKALLGNKYFFIHQLLEVLMIALKIFFFFLWLSWSTLNIALSGVWKNNLFSLPYEYVDEIQFFFRAIAFIFLISIIFNIYRCLKLQKYKK
ncbi:MAG: hypothetical protein JXA99_04015 [Candidatus Lokiarchaeota archaeon]|nr:hypothetical protein [Candidatus Lokiarchaeota archaeon]